MKRIAIGVSACLLGERVRYDGDHSLDPRTAGDFSRVFELIPECPEVGIGLGVPRPKIHLRDSGDGPRLLGTGGEDLTDATRRFARGAAERFRKAEVAGLILKSRSPSCGIGDVPVFRKGPETAGDGLHAATLFRELPEVPAITEARLREPLVRDDWLTRVFGLAEVRRIGSTIQDFYGFHARWKMAMMAHSESRTRRLGRLLAAGEPSGRMFAEYRREFLETLATSSRVGAHQNALRHLAGHLDGERQELHRKILDFGRGEVPLAVPIRHIARLGRDVPTLANQAYLDLRPSPLGYRESLYPAATGSPASTRR